MARALLLLFFGGFSATVFEWLWVRQMGLVFGNTVPSAAAVVAAGAAGLTLGAHVFGRRVEGAGRPLRWFGVMQILLGACALGMPAFLAPVRIAYRWAVLHIPASPWILGSLRFAMAFLVLLVPLALIGGTLPVISKAVPVSSGDFGKRIGWLLGAGALGAAAGILVAGFLLLPRLGLTGTNLVCVAVVLLAGAAAAAGREPARVVDGKGVGNRRMARLVAGLAGFLALAFAVVWLRALILVFGSTPYSFCVVLGALLLGVAAGALLLGWAVDRVNHRLFFLGLLQWGIGFYTLVWMYRFDLQPEFLLRFLLDHGLSWGAVSAAQLLIALKFLFVPAALIGLSVIVAAESHKAAGHARARTAADICAAVAIGAGLGAVLGGLVLLPLLGIEKSLIALSVAAVGCGFLAAAFGGAPWKLSAPALAAVLAALTLILIRPPRWDHETLAAGAYSSPWLFVQGTDVTLRDRLRAEDLLYYKEGLAATVSASRADDGSEYFSMDGRVEADTTASGLTAQRMLGHLPMLFHPDPRRALNLGVGVGVTLGALGCYPLDRLDAVEIEPAALEAAGLWSERNRDILRRPDIRLAIDDGRNHLFCTPEKYDVIASSGLCRGSTVEYFALARSRLAEGGLMCQRIPLDGMPARGFLTVLRSFSHVFPRSLLFFTGMDALLLGFEGGAVPDVEAVGAKFGTAAVGKSLAEIGFATPESVLCMFVADFSQNAEAAEHLDTDDRPVTEFLAPKAAVQYTVGENQQILLDLFMPVPDAWLKEMSADRAQAVKDGQEALRLMLQASLAKGAGDVDAASELLSRAANAANANPVVRNDLAAQLMSSALEAQAAGDYKAASEQFQMALTFDERQFWAYYHLVVLGMLAEKPEFAASLIERGLGLYPDSPLLLVLRAKYRFKRNDWAGCLEDFKKAVAIAPEKSAIWKDYALVLSEMGDAQATEAAAAQYQQLWNEGK